jgi:hypothetical protein
MQIRSNCTMVRPRRSLGGTPRVAENSAGQLRGVRGPVLEIAAGTEGIWPSTQTGILAVDVSGEMLKQARFFEPLHFSRSYRRIE